VTSFFDWVDEKKRGTSFDNPNPQSKTKKDFCGFFKETWAGSYSQKFSIDNSPERFAMEHLKYAYPGKGNFESEFVWLHDLINAPAKTNVSTSPTRLCEPAY
jgi:hypothetical protein